MVKLLKCSKQLVENTHSMGPINEIMDVLHLTDIDRHLETTNKLSTHVEKANNNQINDKRT
jgi:hypothetical protein